MFSFYPTSAPHILNNHLSVQGTAKYSGYSEQYIRLLRNGKLVGIKIGQMWLVDKGTLDAYIKQAQKTTDQRFGAKLSN